MLNQNTTGTLLYFSFGTNALCLAEVFCIAFMFWECKEENGRLKTARGLFLCMKRFWTTLMCWFVHFFQHHNCFVKFYRCIHASYYTISLIRNVFRHFFFGVYTFLKSVWVSLSQLMTNNSLHQVFISLTARPPGSVHKLFYINAKKLPFFDHDDKIRKSV